MTQKDKVKELVGRGLNSYHTKSLQQIDRIEKKNKEQNHKISILSNELDNDYLTKTEEGSVISLEHSKEGMVYLDELQGNTLVNYCTDGSKELTLNGDIDVEGTFVTTTEGVDNGKIDAMCEGNTLVNLIGGLESKAYAYELEDNVIEFDVRASTSTRWPSCKFYVNQLQLGKTYTIIFNVLRADIGFSVGGTSKGEISTIKKGITSKGFVSFKFTLPTTGEVPYLLPIWTEVTPSSTGEKITITKPIILEGDWTDKPIPQYFEGMKSVGQDDTNGHKIEILSQNKNLFDKNKLQVANGSLYGYMYLGENDNYTLSITDKDTSVDMSQVYFGFTKNGKNAEEGYHWLMSNGSTNGSTNLTRGGFPYFSFFPNDSTTLEKITSRFNIQIEKGIQATSHIPYALNKKEILMNEPLRSLPNGVCDRVVKINNKYFIERNCREIIIDGSIDWNKVSSRVFTTVFYTRNIVGVSLGTSNTKLATPVLSLQFPYSNNDIGQTKDDIEGIYTAFDGNLCISIAKAKLSTDDSSGLKSWLQSNPVKAIYQLATPTYEPLEVEPTLNTYNDITHISNNSIIPCNIKIKNSGYNAIIKPSTLYTIALDTNKSGTIGMNLGGAKGTTTNNVLKLTTPATLTDDSLRLYGKGIKGSKVRLLEGDKTNWIPSHFEGMKSSFEDKFDDTDNTYKMEILSNNENLLDLTQHSIGTPYTNHYIIKNNSIIGIYEGDNYTDFQIWFNLKRNRTYKLSYSQESTYKLSGNNSQLLIGKRSSYSDGCVLHQCYNGSAGIITNVPYDGWYTLHFHSLKNNNTIKDLQLKESNLPTDFVERKSNKIQFSSIEPLRSTKDISDRFIFKDGKIMIERNCIERDLTYFKFFTTEIKGLNLKGGITISDAYKQPQGGANTTMKCDKLASDFKEDTIPCINIYHHANQNELRVSIPQRLLKTIDKDGINDYFVNNPHKVIYRLAEPTYEEIPFELQKIILEGYENGTLFFDTNIPPTSIVTYAGETPIVKATKLNKTEVLNNTNDINDNIIPYLMDMDYRVVCLQLQSEEFNGGVAMARLFGGTYEMLQRDIQSKRYSEDEYRHRLDAYLGANKITEEEYNKLGDMLNE